MKSRFLSLVILALASTAARPLAAQAPAAGPSHQPLVVVAGAGIGPTLRGLETIVGMADMKDVAGGPLKIAKAQATAFGLDVERPWGVAVPQIDSTMPVVAFVPVADFDLLMSWVKVAPVQLTKVAAGAYAIQTPLGPSIYVQERKGWLLLAPSLQQLADVPDDPTTWLGGLDKKYLTSARFRLQSIPAAYKILLTEALKAGAQAGLIQMPGEDDAAFAARRRVVEQQIQQLESVLTETDSITMGWSVNSNNKTISGDLEWSAVAGSALAKQFAQAGNLKSEFNGFMPNEAAYAARMTAAVAQADVGALTAAADSARDTLSFFADQDKSLSDEQRRPMKEALTEFFDVVKKTLAAGQIDGAGAVLLDGQSVTAVAGGGVASGDALEAAWKKFMVVAEKLPDAPTVKYNIDTREGVRFHSMSAPVPNDATLRMLFGDKLDVIVGFGPKSFYVAAGKQPLETLKKAIDASKQGNQNVVPPLSFVARLTPLLKFASAVGPIDRETKAALAGLLADEKVAAHDRMTVTAKIVENGEAIHFEVEEGIVRAIGAAARMSIPGVAAPPAARPDRPRPDERK